MNGRYTEAISPASFGCAEIVVNMSMALRNRGGEARLVPPSGARRRPRGAADLHAGERLQPPPNHEAPGCGRPRPPGP